MVLILRPTILDHNIAALYIANLFKALSECGRHGCIAISGSAVQKTDHRHGRLLRARRDRPRGRRAAKQLDERAPFHSITSSARASSVGGMSRPSAFAVLRLMMNSNLIGCCTGKSAGLVPLRIRST